MPVAVQSLRWVQMQFDPRQNDGTVGGAAARQRVAIADTARLVTHRIDAIENPY